MIDEFNELMQYFAKEDSFTTNEWYDDGFMDVIEVLRQFTNEDWQKVLEELPTKSDVWKKRLAYCIHSKSDVNQLKVLMAMANTDNEDLLKIVIAGLKEFNLEGNEQRENIVKKVEQFLPSDDRLSQEVFSDFIEKNTKKK